jgi:hypothetical protein
MDNKAIKVIIAFAAIFTTGIAFKNSILNFSDTLKK